MAITLETTYGRAGYAPDWIEPDDLRKLGRDVALAVRDYADPDISWAALIMGPKGKPYDRILNSRNSIRRMRPMR